MLRISKPTSMPSVAALALILACVVTFPLRAEKYTPAGYGPGQNVEGTGYGFDIGYKQIAEDYYITLKPTLEFGLLDFRIGLQIPVEVLVYDFAPKGDKKTPSIREGTFDDIEDYTKLIRYIRYGTHLYFNPDDAFNWSFYYGAMTDGYIGHKTIIYRYVSTYDPTVFRAGLMADINNSWGGIEVFQSDVWRREVVAGRAYIRPMGIFYGVRDLLVASGRSTVPNRRQLALSFVERNDPNLNGGVFYQDGSIGQKNLTKMRDVEFAKDEDVQFVERKNPVTGETEVRAIRNPKTGKSGDPDSTKSGAKGRSIGDTVGKTDSRRDPGRVAPSKGGSDEPAEKWGKTFWSRWAIGYTVARDVSAPLTLERDGSNNLVIDPETLRPRGLEDDVLTIVGMDTEFRLSPFKWLELTPYADLNKVKDLDKSEGTHIGVDMGFRLLKGFLKFSLRPEYREFSSNYLPTYFDSYYSIERTVYIPDGTSSNDGTVSDNSQPKLEYLRGLPDDGGKTKGYFIEMIFSVQDWVTLEATYEDYDGLDNSRVFVGLFVPNLFGSGFYTNGYYTKKGFDQIGESFEFDDRALAAGEAGLVFYGAFYVQISYERSWEYDSTQSAFVANDEKKVSFGFSSDM